MRNKSCIICSKSHQNSLSKCCSPACSRKHTSNLKKLKEEKIKVKKEKVKTKKAFSRSKLIAECDRVFSIFIRERDRWNPCITCWSPWTDTVQAGHFQSRRHLNTRWHPMNCNWQCVADNNWWWGEQYKHWKAIDRIYGEWTAEWLERLARDTSKTTDEEILMHIKYYYGELDKMLLDFKPKSIYLTK